MRYLILFLQYPLEDVTSFVENRGKNFLLSGYWKVYHNIEKAKEIFTSYDKAKEELNNKISSVSEIIYSYAFKNSCIFCFLR